MALVATGNSVSYFRNTVDPLIKALQPGVQLVDSFTAGEAGCAVRSSSPNASCMLIPVFCSRAASFVR